MRAARYAQVISSEAKANGSVRVINLHNKLADSRGFLRPEFRRLAGFDAHPNAGGISALIELICAGLIGISTALSTIAAPD
jgi:hypothetical protein